jgi:hypothetical protein
VVWLTIREADLGVRFLGLSSQQQQITTGQSSHTRLDLSKGTTRVRAADGK